MDMHLVRPLLAIVSLASSFILPRPAGLEWYVAASCSCLSASSTHTLQVIQLLIPLNSLVGHGGRGSASKNVQVYVRVRPPNDRELVSEGYTNGSHGMQTAPKVTAIPQK